MQTRESYLWHHFDKYYSAHFPRTPSRRHNIELDFDENVLLGRVVV